MHMGLVMLCLVFSVPASAQIKISGNVYGGGNQAMVMGSTKVTVRSGDIGAPADPEEQRPLANPRGRVFGGGRLGNVGGQTFVDIDGKHATGFILINQVYGGNDVAGTIGTGAAVGEQIPDELEGVRRVPADDSDVSKDSIDNTWNSYVRVSTKLPNEPVYYTEEEIAAGADDPEHYAYGKTTRDYKQATDAEKIYIGQLFGGGNGDYDHANTDPDGDGYYTQYFYNWSDKNHESPIAQLRVREGESAFVRPATDKTYLEIKGGSIVYAYGGGNNVTVNDRTVIHIDNPSDVVNHIFVDETTGLEDKEAEEEAGSIKDLLIAERFTEMGINTTFSQPSSGAFQIGRFFGGNNKAEMEIRPTWNLLAGKVRNLYSGGNRGAMTSPEGLLLDIPDYSTLIVDNLYGGCRMADVRPTKNGLYSPTTTIYPYKFPSEMSARTLVRGGHINNVYGGNDVTGIVYGGNAVGIYTTIYGNVYGGGNGSYPYTDNPELEEDATYGDFYYGNLEGYTTSYERLNAYRPNAEQVSIRLKGGADDQHATVIHGSVYVGGNCSTIKTKKANPLVELKMGSHVIADNVFLGNNGEGMVNTEYLKLYGGAVDEDGKYTEEGGADFSSMDLTDASVFAGYMEGVCMDLMPSITFDSKANGDRDDYDDFSSYIGSLFCGGNVGSMTVKGKQSYTVNRPLNIYSKFVGGCRNADVAASEYNAAYQGGVLGSEDEREDYTDGEHIKDRLEINLENLTITPLRWDDTNTRLIWNTNEWDDVYAEIEAGTELAVGDTYYTYNSVTDAYTQHIVEGSPIVADGTTQFEKTGEDFKKVPNIDYDKDRDGEVDDDFVSEDYENVRLLGGNVYGGCYESGHVNGNVVININEAVLQKDAVFGTGTGPYGRRASGVNLLDQRDDLLTVALSVFGAGYGEDTEIWGSTTVNLNKGYVFQIFGGGELGVVGKKQEVKDEHGIVTGHEYSFDPAYSSTVNLNGATAIYSTEGTAEDLAEAEYLYGGGNEGDICGNTYVNLGNGRIYDAIGGASDADVWGHTEVIIGRQPDGNGGYKQGFPWVRDIVYGGNDFGGTIRGAYEDGDFTTRIRDYETYKTQMHGYAEGKHDYMLKASSYVEYLQGRVDTIFGGSYGYYDYQNTSLYGSGSAMPRQESAFVNLRPVVNDRNRVNAVFGAGTGYPGNREDDKAQNHSYVLIDIPDGVEKFKNMEVYGAGSYNGVGMRERKEITFAPGYDRDKCSAVIDLLHGEIAAAYGGSYNEGNTCRTVVNVPEQSSIKITNIFGGAYGIRILPPCDVIQSNVNYRNTSEQAVVKGAIYGGNNSQRRTIFTNVKISSPVWSNKEKGYLATVYGAGKGFNSWSEHTLVEMLSGAKVYEVYGGGEMGHVLNAETVQKYMQNEKDKPSANIAEEIPWNDASRWDGLVGSGTVKAAYKDEWDSNWMDAWSLGDYYTPNNEFNNYFETFAALRGTSLVRKAEIDERDYSAYSSEEKEKRQNIYNTNVIINEGAEVVNYAYGGGLGASNSPLSGDVWGSTYIALLGGKVKKDIYAAGTTGAVSDMFAGVGAYDASTNPYGFTASATAYIKGGTCRNVYGGGWEGNVGLHTGGISDSPAADIPGETYVVIGDLDGTSFTDGIPTIQRNAYGGGEGGAVYGTANVRLNKGYIGYEYKNDEYVEKIEDETKATPNTNLANAGCLFGGGYIDNSVVDKTNVVLNGGVVRNSVFGGGEIAAIGRGVVNKVGGVSSLAGIYRPGKTFVDMYGGHVLRDVYGGGRGYDNLGRVGSLNTAGYIFGQTEVHVHGGEIGTAAGLAKGYGNVFGACDIGHVYSAYENSDGTFGKGVKDGERYDEDKEGYYYKHEWADEGSYVLKDGEREYTEDCKVLVEPMCQAKLPVSIDGTGYAPGEFVPIEKLNKLRDKNTDSYLWGFLDDTGIIIHNSVFAGGNSPSGAIATSANTESVFGNATASIHDVFHRDLITLGTAHTGGLYGDGNLTLVDGYRELNITNYGTDFYSIAKEISIDTYHALPEREAAYYELKYTCLKDCKDKENTQYHSAVGSSKASTITADELQTLFLVKSGDTYVSVKDGGTDILIYNSATHEWEPNPTYWEESGVLPVYAGRLMNSIQRADFCGVFGSRMVMQGAQDRVPDEADYTNYTINRVREVSLNKKSSTAGDAVEHGNYFGIYNIVNYLGALTSDVDFGDDTTGDIRTTDNSDTSTYQTNANGKAYGTATFYDWKKEFHDQRKRNNGNSHNKVALASGVYLEITSEKGTGTGLYEKDWGPITGVVELDLINVSPGVGGGFVYAQNIHGKRKLSGKKNTILTELNTGAITQKKFQYDDDGSASADYKHDTTDDHWKTEWQSSGNFVHSTQTIVDDCYNVSNRYMSGYMAPSGVPAHYWYIKGTTYVYDQYISSYTGSNNAYSESMDMPLTIAAASHGRMKLVDVKPNLYAYYSAPGVKLENGKKVIINDKTYYQNDPISYWDWSLLPTAERDLFVEKTYTNCVSVSIDGGTVYEPGTFVMTDTEYNSYGAHTYQNAEGETIRDAENNVAGKEYIFRESNNVSHDTGYLLTYEVDNPSKWDTWYTQKTGTGKKSTAEYDELTSVQQLDYEDGPTYRLKGSTSTMLGQQTYAVGDIISKNVEDTYQAVAEGNRPSGQATFQPAYIVTQKITVTEGDVERHYNPGTTVSKTFADAHSGSVELAYVCTKTVQISDDNHILKGSKVKQSEWQTLYNTLNAGTDAQKKIAAELLANVVPAYYCTVAGRYGGNYYQPGKNYRGLETWSSMSESDREQFVFNYDALDLLIDPSYSIDGGQREGQKYQYDGEDNDGVGFTTETQAKTNAAGYSLEQSVDYTATYNGDDTGTYNGVTLEKDREYSREDFEKLPNEQRHYAPIAVTDPGYYYVVNTAFQVGATPYAVGSTISREAYDGLPDQSYVTELTIDEAHKNATYYYCREEYTATESVTAISSSAIPGARGGVSGSNVELGTLITQSQYNGLPNKQTNFTIHGVSPTETSTLYVTRESDIYDLSKEKIITVIYQYDYEESDGSGNVTPVSERHVLNIHLQFKSGVPIVEDIDKPELILPGWFNIMRDPEVTPGAYEVTGSGWEIFESKTDAERHTNGLEYSPTSDPLYWYQDGYYVAYYAKTYLGRTYSNAVPVSVANYHDLADVMSDANKTHHMYIDEKGVKREPKIYINDYSGSGKNGLDLFKDLYDLSVLDGYSVDEDGLITTEGDFEGHKPLNATQVRGGKNLEFFLRTDIRHPETWTSIGTEAQCFEGVLHGDGHTISGLDKSLFYKLCGEVYNLGVMGSFNTAGIVDKGDGYVESCWVKTTNDTPLGSKPNAVFGNPTDTKGYQVVNSYFWNGNKNLYGNIEGDDSAVLDYKETITSGGARGKATAKSDTAFYNGELAYDLNNFYLYKRYSDKKVTSGTEKQKYSYFTIGDDGNLELQNNHYYGSHADLCSTGYEAEESNVIMYVEDRFADGDFRYAGGTIPDTENERYYSWKVNEGTEQETEESSFFPIYPDDYIFFGQKLTYGYAAEDHQEVPTAVVRDEGRLSLNSDANRVFRAPAYFRSKDMGVAHFNPAAYLAQMSADGTKMAYPNMTAIDFAGHNDNTWGMASVSGVFSDGSPAFYPPLLDDDGLTGIENCDETQNLLVYAPAASGESGYVNSQTHGVLTSYFVDPVYNDHYDNTNGYRLVSENNDNIHGHLIQSDLTATNDHLLVDKQDFNAPMGYHFDGSHRMWYQRRPTDKEYVDHNAGWQGISLPFTAELVTTDTKGEITHFYSGSETSKNGTETKIGHEYWLREFSDIKEEGTEPVVAKADFLYPTAYGDDKEVTNTFLWDYYYKNTDRHNQKDANDDTYLQYQQYYKTTRNYEAYPLLTAATPYILGLPGSTYYEFDLSGKFEALNTATPVARLGKQIITFASRKATSIGVSDDEMEGKKLSYKGNNYTFRPSYMNMTLTESNYVLNSDGNAYVRLSADAGTNTTNKVTTSQSAFRPYFIAATAPSGAKKRMPQEIVFCGDNDWEIDEPLSVVDGTLEIYAKDRKIITRSYLTEPVAVTIVNVAGVTYANYVLQPGETIETPVYTNGIYIVNKKKLLVK